MGIEYKRVVEESDSVEEVELVIEQSPVTNSRSSARSPRVDRTTSDNSAHHYEPSQCIFIVSYIIYWTCVMVGIIVVLFLIIGVPIIVVKADKQAQLDKVEDLTGSTILDTDRFRRYGIAVTEDGQVCMMKSRREVNCIREFHQGVAVRYDTSKNGQVNVGKVTSSLILSRDGIIYVILEGGKSMPKSSYIFGTWTSKELNRYNQPIQYYQQAKIKHDYLVAIGDPVYPTPQNVIRD
jgi:hypothetical protein